MGRPGQASLGTPVPSVPARLLAPAVAALPAPLALPPLPVETADPPLLEREPALVAGCKSMVLPGSSPQPFTPRTSNVTTRAIELERLRMFPHFTVGQP
jgi:hypothetical protein